MKKSTWSKDGILKFGDFDRDYTFKGFASEQFRKYSNQYAYLVGSHVSEDGNNAVIKVSSNHVIPTRYGYAVIVDAKRERKNPTSMNIYLETTKEYNKKSKIAITALFEIVLKLGGDL